MKTKFTLLTLGIFALGGLNAQVPVLEKTYDISKQARKGNLGGIEIDNEKETFDMIYIYSTGKRGSVGREIYSYDKELNLINNTSEELPVDRVKYSWFDYRGESYTTNYLSSSFVMNGMYPGLVFRKKQINAWYNECLGIYEKNIKVLESVKPKTEDGAKYGYTAGIEVPVDSSVIVLACKPEKKTLNSQRLFDIIKCDNNVNISVMESIELPYANQAIFSQQLQDDHIDIVSNYSAPRDWIVVFAPVETGKHHLQYKDKPTNLTYLRITPKGKLVEKVTFESPSNGWRINGAYEKDGSVFLYGPAITKDPENKFHAMVLKATNVPTTTTSAEDARAINAAATSSNIPGMGVANAFNGSMEFGSNQESLDAALDLLKYTNYQLCKISNGKLDFISSPNIEEFVSKQAKPEGQKKYVKFDGKKFIVSGISISKTGDVFVNGQDFSLKDDKKVFGGVYVFHFDNTGTLKKNYGIYIDRDDKDARYILTRVKEYDSGDGNMLYCFLKSAQRFKTDKEKQDMRMCNLPIGFKTTVKSEIPLFQYEYTSIDLAAGTMSAVKTFGEGEKKELYLMKKTGIYTMNNYRLFFSETKKGDKILLNRIDISK